VILDKDKMAENGIDPMGISQMIQANNSSSPSASFVNQDEEYLITTGKFLTSADDVENLVVGLNKNRPVYLRQVASVQDGPSTALCVFWLWKTNDNYKSAQSEYPAVTISVGKVKGADAMFGENSSRTFKDNDYSERCSCRNNQKLWGNGKVVNCCTWVSLFSSYFLGDAGHGWRNWSSILSDLAIIQPLYAGLYIEPTLFAHLCGDCRR
jgi:hypothetical protein